MSEQEKQKFIAAIEPTEAKLFEKFCAQAQKIDGLTT